MLRLFILVSFYFLLVVECHTVRGGITVLLEKSQPGLKNSTSHGNSAKPIDNNPTAISNDEKLILTRDKVMRNLWRTEQGELMKVITANEHSTERKSTSSGPDFWRHLNPAYNEVVGNGPYYNNEPIFPANMHGPSKPVPPFEYGQPSNSARMGRTFWPFTSMFGYDFPYAQPPPPLYGPAMFSPPPALGGGVVGFNFQAPSFSLSPSFLPFG